VQARSFDACEARRPDCSLGQYRCARVLGDRSCDSRHRLGMLARLPGARAKEIVKALERAGFLFQQGSRAFYRHPQTRRTTVVPMHSKELPRWRLKKISKEAGLTEDEFRNSCDRSVHCTLGAFGNESMRRRGDGRSKFLTADGFGGWRCAECRWVVVVLLG
jgi:mRNA interferase HicA